MTDICQNSEILATEKFSGFSMGLKPDVSGFNLHIYYLLYRRCGAVSGPISRKYSVAAGFTADLSPFPGIAQILKKMIDKFEQTFYPINRTNVPEACKENNDGKRR